MHEILTILDTLIRIAALAPAGCVSLDDLTSTANSRESRDAARG